ANWPDLRERIAAAVKTRTRDEWADLARDNDACLAPVLTPAEAARHPYNAARATFVDVSGSPHPAPAPRFDRTPASVPTPPVSTGVNTGEVLAGIGVAEDRIMELRRAGVIG